MEVQVRTEQLSGVATETHWQVSRGVSSFTRGDVCDEVTRERNACAFYLADPPGSRAEQSGLMTHREQIYHRRVVLVRFL